MKSNEEFLSFLYEKKSEGYSSQMVFVSKNNKIVWFPGNRSKNFFIPALPSLVGFTGRCYKDITKDQHRQDFEICWCGIDIDDYNNVECLHEIVPECTIRESKSGKGVHLFFRFKSPVKCEIGTAGSIVKESLRPFVNRLEDFGLGEYVCKWDGNVFFLVSENKQKVLYKSEDFINFVDPASVCMRLEQKKIFNHGEFSEFGNLNPNGKNLLKFLCLKGLTDSFETQNIYVKSWFETLKNTPYAFKTRSSMQSKKTHVNGKVFIEGKFFCIFTNADGYIVKRIKIKG